MVNVCVCVCFQSNRATVSRKASFTFPPEGKSPQRCFFYINPKLYPKTIQRYILKTSSFFLFMLQVSISGNGQSRAVDPHERKGRREVESRFHCPPRQSWRWAGTPATVIQAFVVLQTQTLNMIRCWLDNDTVWLVFYTYQVTVFTTNIMGEIRKHCSAGRVSQRELKCVSIHVWVCMHALVPPIIRQHAPAHTHRGSFKEVVFIKSRFFAILGSVTCHCCWCLATACRR